MAGRTQKLIIVLLRAAVGGVFIYAGALKALDPAQFATDVDNFRLLPYAASCAVAVYLPWLEILAGTALALGVLRSGAVLILGAFLGVFLVALSSAWVRGLDISCGCFGQARNHSNYPLSLLIDLILLAALWVVSRPALKETQH
jgi:uncharacterized membrane protein YphA (DoxX/SURF4 family)